MYSLAISHAVEASDDIEKKDERRLKMKLTPFSSNTLIKC